MLSASRPRQKGSRYSSTAVLTGSGRWLNVAQPKPYKPGSLVSTLTTTKRTLGWGEVRIVRTLIVFNGPRDLVAALPDSAAQAWSVLQVSPRNVAAAPSPAPFSISRRFIILLSLIDCAAPSRPKALPPSRHNQCFRLVHCGRVASLVETVAAARPVLVAAGSAAGAGRRRHQPAKMEPEMFIQVPK